MALNSAEMRCRGRQGSGVGVRHQSAHPPARPLAARVPAAPRPSIPPHCHKLSRRPARRLHVRASWGAPVDFTPAKVVATSREAEALQRIRVDLGGLASNYTLAGQFIQAKASEDGKAGFYAIASAPDKENGIVDLLIKAQGQTAEQVVATPAGGVLYVSPPMGKGFPIDRIPPEQFPTVFLFATGSGISPIRALIESGALQTDKRATVRLYYGTANGAALAFKDSLPAWEAAGVEVVPVFSEEGQGYVQDAFARDAATVSEGDWAGTAAVLCGHKEMAEAVTELLGAKGVQKEHCLLNF